MYGGTRARKGRETLEACGITIGRMALRVVRIEPTPNPNAVKLVVEPPPAGGIRSYFNAAQAEGETDPLAHALFAIPGVTSLLIHETFVSVNKSPDASWGPIKKAAERVIGEHS